MLIGGGSGCKAGGEEVHEARSCGKSAAVQSRPIHHRWFSRTVNRKRRVDAGGTSGRSIGDGPGVVLDFAFENEVMVERTDEGGDKDSVDGWPVAANQV